MFLDQQFGCTKIPYCICEWIAEQMLIIGERKAGPKEVT